MGYVLECENYEEQFDGLGKEHSQYDVVFIRNTRGSEIMHIGKNTGFGFGRYHVS